MLQPLALGFDQVAHQVLIRLLVDHQFLLRIELLLDLLVRGVGLHCRFAVDAALGQYVEVLGRAVVA